MQYPYPFIKPSISIRLLVVIALTLSTHQIKASHEAAFPSENKMIALNRLQADEDGDGVDDNVDACPGTPAGESVDANGCGQSQTDGDNDGVVDG